MAIANYMQFHDYYGEDLLELYLKALEGEKLSKKSIQDQKKKVLYKLGEDEIILLKAELDHELHEVRRKFCHIQGRSGELMRENFTRQ